MAGNKERIERNKNKNKTVLQIKGMKHNSGVNFKQNRKEKENG